MFAAAEEMVAESLDLLVKQDAAKWTDVKKVHGTIKVNIRFDLEASSE